MQNTLKVLDKGFIRLIDIMGNDLDIVKAARISLGNYTKGDEQDKKLVNFLMNNGHETPFEHVVFKFHIKCPMFVARQWFRHRWGSFNEISARYTKIQDEFYMPTYFRKQAKKNYKYEKMSEQECNQLYSKLENYYKAAYGFYLKLVDENQWGVAKELARIVLPEGRYTQFYWTVNARSLMNFFKLRLDEHAQEEIREYAKELFKFFSNEIPWTAEAFAKKELIK